MSSMVSHRSIWHLALCLTLSLVISAPVVAQSVSYPVVQPLPPGYTGSGAPVTPAAGAPLTASPLPAAPLIVPMIGGGGEWDQARARLRMSGATAMAQTIERWKLLSKYDSSSFSEYSGFILSNPGFPGEDKLRRNAEKALERENAEPSRLVAFFDRNPPLTNSARAQYAAALSALGRRDAQTQALAAWRGGPMSDAAEVVLGAMLAGQTSPADQDARMDALLWSGMTAQAERQFFNI